MGRIFLEHMGGENLYNCATCDTNVTNRQELISTRFTGSSGRAFLFKKVINVTFGKIENRVMLTGRHLVRDVSCKNCNTKLGWLYEYAVEENQRYKEGRIILEKSLIVDTLGLENEV